MFIGIAITYCLELLLNLISFKYAAIRKNTRKSECINVRFIKRDQNFLTLFFCKIVATINVNELLAEVKSLDQFLVHERRKPLQQLPEKYEPL